MEENHQKMCRKEKIFRVNLHNQKKVEKSPQKIEK